MMKTRSKLLKEVYPVLLFISLLMSWEFTTQGSPTNPGASLFSPSPEFHELLKTEPVCRLPLFASREPACLKDGNVTSTPPFERKFPWETPAGTRLPKAKAGWESL